MLISVIRTACFIKSSSVRPSCCILARKRDFHGWNNFTKSDLAMRFIALLLPTKPKEEGSDAMASLNFVLRSRSVLTGGRCSKIFCTASPGEMLQRWLLHWKHSYSQQESSSFQTWNCTATLKDFRNPLQILHCGEFAFGGSGEAT